MPYRIRSILCHDGKTVEYGDADNWTEIELGEGTYTERSQYRGKISEWRSPEYYGPYLDKTVLKQGNAVAFEVVSVSDSELVLKIQGSNTVWVFGVVN